jgi:hypothetical protein
MGSRFALEKEGIMSKDLKMPFVWVVVPVLLLAAERCMAAVLAMPVLGAGTFGQLPPLFIENRGRCNPPVSYYMEGRDNGVYFTPGGVTFELASPQQGNTTPLASGEAAAKTDIKGPERRMVKLEFQGANPEVRPLAEAPSQTIVSYFKGRPEQWHTGLKTYGRIRYPDLWLGIDLVYYATANGLEYQFQVKPGADPGQIRLSYREAGGEATNEAVQLDAATPMGTLRNDRPVSWQEMDGRRVEVNIDYTKEPITEGSRSYGYELGAYSPDRTLMIDPPFIVFAGYIGGSGVDSYPKVALDNAGNAYVTGFTNSASFSENLGPDLANAGNGDAFVAKVSADGSALIYIVYIGGSNADDGRSIAVDSEGNAYIVGKTKSDQTSFPVKSGPDPTYNGGTGDAFVAKVNAAGTDLVYAGYIGGDDSEEPHDIAVDAAGNAYVTGWTGSDETTFPVKPKDGRLGVYGGGGDAFVAKVTVDGRDLEYAGYIGGMNSDTGYGIAVEGAGIAYVAGRTDSSEGTFPVNYGPGLIYNGGGDAFVARVMVDGRDLEYAGYIGGDGVDAALSVAFDAAGCAYVTGLTASKETIFPVKPKDGRLATYKGGVDAFVAKVTPSGGGLVYAGYIGGSSSDSGHGIAVDLAGQAYVTGSTDSTEASFPVKGCPDLMTYKGKTDAFVAKVRADGSRLVYAGYIGGSESDIGLGIAVDRAGNAYVTGHTLSSEASFPVKAGHDPTYNGDLDVFLAKVSPGKLRPKNTWYLDYDGDGKWEKDRDLLYAFGLPGDIPISGKWTESSTKDNIGVMRGGKWYLDSNGNGIWDPRSDDLYCRFGQPGDLPVKGRISEDKDSKTDQIGFMRGRRWRLDKNNDHGWDKCNVDQCYTFGDPGDTPVMGDWNGDGKDEIGVFRAGEWYLDYNGNGVLDTCGVDLCYFFGSDWEDESSLPVVGNWSGEDKRDKIGVKIGNIWYLDYNGNGKRDVDPKDRKYTFGKPLDIPVVGDWNGDGKDEIGVVRMKP